MLLPMPSFDFITHAGFRTSLEADHAEMERCFDTQSWKSVSVIAGSIVEALLIDYLVATQATRKGKDPLRMDLSEAIAVCKAEGVLTDRTADLSSVVRSYRNLIHPGRTVRMNEAQPNESSAKIAVAVVDIISEEVAQKRKAAFGLTAEQIASKVERDPASLAILKHLLEEVSAHERQRLLLDVLPSRYLELNAMEESQDFDLKDILDRVKKAHHLVYTSVPEDIQAAAAARFVEILKNEDGTTVSTYADAFFQGAYLADVADAHSSMVKEYLLSRMQPTLDILTVDLIKGFEQTLDPVDVVKWVDPIVRVLTAGNSKTADKNRARMYFVDALFGTKPSFDRAVESRLLDWERHFKDQGSHHLAEILTELRSDVPPAPPPPPPGTSEVDDEDDDLPF
jgi:hypothetical protein